VRVKPLRPATAGEVFLDVAFAEITSPNYRNRYTPTFGHHVDRLSSTGLDQWSRDEQRRAEAIVRDYRRGPLEPLTWGKVTLSLSEARTEELGEVRLMNLSAFNRFAPSRKLDEFVKNLDAGKAMPDDEFAAKYARVRPVFDPSKTRGHPVLFATGPAGPYVEAEGLTRMCCLLSMSTADEDVPNSIEVYTGIGARVADWYFYGSP
jgi:hypothetical protein